VTSGRASPPARDATAAHAHRERRAACCVERARRRDTPRTRRALPQGIQRLTRPGAANSTAVHVARGDAPPHQSPLNRRPRTPGTSHEASQFGRGLDPLTQCHPRCAAPRRAGQSGTTGGTGRTVSTTCGIQLWLSHTLGNLPAHSKWIRTKSPLFDCGGDTLSLDARTAFRDLHATYASSLGIN